MNEVRIIKFIDNILQYGIMFIAAVIPIYFPFLYETQNIFELNKVVLFRLLVEILLIFWIVKIVISKQFSLNIGRRNLLIIAFLFCAYIITIFFAVDRPTGFWGTYNRQAGLLTYLHYFALFLIFIDTVKSRHQAERIIASIVIGSFIVSLYGILEWFGLDYLSWYRFGVHSPFTRIMSTIGQPVFLGNYLVLTIFLAVYKFIKSKHFYHKMLLFVVFAFQLTALTFTYTRGAWIAFAAGAILLGIAGIRKIKSFNALKYILAAILTISIIFGFLIHQKNQGSFIAERLASIADTNFGSFAMRFKIWNISLQAILEKPFFGYGLDNQEYVLASHYEPSWNVLETINDFPDRAHNEILDTALTGGMVLVAADILLLLAVFSQMLRWFKNQKQDNLLFFIPLSIFSYQISLLSSFSVVETNIIFYILLAIIFLIARKPADHQDTQKQQKDIFSSKEEHRLEKFSLLSLLFVPLAIYLIFYNINSIRADIAYRSAIIASSDSETEKTIDKYEEAIFLNPYENRYKWFYMAYLSDSLKEITDATQKKTLIDFIDSIYDIEKINKSNYKEVFLKAQISGIKGKYNGDKAYIEASEKNFLELMKEYTFYPNLYKYWGNMYFDIEDYQKALVIYKIALTVIPDEDDPAINIPEYIQHKNDVNIFRNDINYKIASCYFMLKEYPLALDYTDKILKLNPYFNVYALRGKIFYQLHNTSGAIESYARAIKTGNDELENYISLAIIYKEIKDQLKYNEIISRGLEKFPDSQELTALKNEQ